nr:ribonuclease H-like domain-containing protein [Tanacetum cinerariifolium]
SRSKAILKVLRYLKGFPGCGIQFNKMSNLKLGAYVDADWAKCTKTRKLVIGFCVFLGQSLVSWKSKNKLHCLKAHLKQSINDGGDGWDDGGRRLDGGCWRLGWWPSADRMVVAAKMRWWWEVGVSNGLTRLDPNPIKPYKVGLIWVQLSLSGQTDRLDNLI